MNTALSNNRPVMLMAGGTGGHVFPALAIAEGLRASGQPVCWLGTSQGLEARVVPAADIPLHRINIGGLRGKGKPGLLLAPFRILRAVWQAVTVLRQTRPLLIIGMGGFVSGPGGVAARLLGIPLLIHEQNAIAGLTNRLLSRIATQTLEAFPGTFPAERKAICTGNPLRANLLALSSPQPRPLHQPLHLLVIGGSLGASALNKTLPAVLKSLPADALSVWHQTGRQHIEQTQLAYADTAIHTNIVAFIEDMAEAYQWADVVVCRAGAMTVSELAQAGVASVLIPFPHAVDDHQTHNARFLADKGAALLIQQTDFTPQRFQTLLESWLHDPLPLQQMAAAAKQCAQPDALQHVLMICRRFLPTA